VLTRNRKLRLPGAGLARREAWWNLPPLAPISFVQRENNHGTKIFEEASSKVERAMKKNADRTLKSGRSGKTVKSRKQAIAIGLSEARPRERKSRRSEAPRSETARQEAADEEVASIIE